MVFVKSLLGIVLLLVTSQAVPLQEKIVNNKILEDFKENQFLLQQNVVPIHYNVKLIPHIENNFTTNGETNIDVEVRESTSAITLHIVELIIDESLTKITRKDVDNVNSESEYVPKQHEYNSLTQILTLRFEDLLDPGIYTLHFIFTGMIRSDVELRGLYRSFYINDKGNKIWLAVTHFQPTFARQAFPCWDEPAIKATFKFSIKHYPNYTALSNMPSVRSEIDEVDRKLWTYFETTPIISTNLLGFVIADYDHISNSNGNVKIWGPKHLLSHAAHSLNIANKAMQELEQFTNSTVPVPKMDHVAIPHYNSRATENWGMIIYSKLRFDDWMFVHDLLSHAENRCNVSNIIRNKQAFRQSYRVSLISSYNRCINNNVMAIVKSLLAAVVLFLTIQSVLLQVYNETVNSQVVKDFNENQFRLRHNVVPIHYDIKLIPHIVENNFTTNCETDIDIKVRESTNAIELHVVNLTIDESLTKLTRKCVDVNYELEYVPKQHEYNSLTQILTLQFEELLNPGIYTLHFTFMGVIYSYHDVGHKVRRGLYRRSYYNDKGNKIWLAVTHFQTVYARQVFPCWDEPAIKATFKFSIKHYPNYTALSNMPSMRSEIDEVDGKLWTYFETTPIMSTYLLGFLIAADYNYVSNLDSNIKIWGPKHLLSRAAYSLDIAEKATQELEKFTNSTVPVSKMDHVAIPRYDSRATENWGLIVYKQDILLGDKSLYSVGNKWDIMTITHELAHQWFGNLVSSIWWKYLWLSEGISTYLKYYITDKFLKEKRLMDYIVVVDEQQMLYTDSVLSTPIHINITGHLDVFNAYSDRTYRKSAFLLRMISHFLREDVFRNGLIKYLQAHEYSSATPDDLWKALQEALDESDVPHNDFQVKDVMDTWFEQAWYPLVTVHRDYATDEIKLTQEIFINPKNNFNYRGNKEEAWWIPINFATQSNLDFSSTLATHWLKPHDKDITIEGVNINDWIIVNKHLTGFYRVNYDITNWRKIAAFLNSDNYDKIPVLNRVQILDDAYNMIETERLDTTIYVEIINYLSRETDPAPWLRALNNVKKLKDYLRLPKGEEILKPYLSNLMRQLFELIDFEENPDDDFFIQNLRMYVYEYECVYGLSDCQAKITPKLLEYVEDPISNSIPLFQREKLYCFGLIKANESLWDQFLQTHQRTSKPHKQFLGCSENLNILEKHLNSFSEDTERYDNLFNNMFSIFPTTDVAIKFFINNHENIHESLILKRIIYNSFREEELDKIKAFAEQHAINIQTDLNFRKATLDEMNNNLSKFLSALENGQLINIFSNDTS
ncbi:aminopeptidase Q [Solenopsis invicta]|uniref:aminopeptidase Q n=1 Tax=Solenopsis invicta TaxID=13686 RepID=UPI00193CA884|nr:aminopeptidase Q [Solenopsis invicta]